MLMELVGPRLASALLDVGFFGGLYATLWGAAKLSYEKVVGAPPPRHPVIIGLDVLAEFLPNILGAVHTAAKKTTGQRLFLPQQADKQ